MISTRGKYGIKAMVDLALHYNNEGCTSLKNIAKRQNIPENYLEQLMAVLKKDEFIKSIRGPQGGYTLNKAPNLITIGSLIKTLEGNLSIVDCVENNSTKKKCGTADCAQCVVLRAWEIINDKMAETANSITLEDLVNINKI